MDKTEWICRSSNTQEAKEAIIIFTAKEVGTQDTLTQYEAYLKQPKVAVNKAGKSIPAKLRKIDRSRIKNHEWVDAMLTGSEIPNFTTRYLATVKSKVAVLITFTAHQRYFTKYSRDFFNAINSLEVIATDSLLQRKNTLGGSGDSLLGTDIGGAIPVDMLVEGECFSGDEDCLEETADSDILDYVLIFAFLVLGVGAYMVLKK